MGIEKYLNQIRKYTPLTKKEEREFFIKAKSGDKAAYDHIMQSNLRFVVSVAKQYQNQGLDLDDLIAEGNLGLVKAYEKFDYSKNYKFITYAVWWIRQSILSAIQENAKVVKVPVNKLNNITKISKIRQQLEQENLGSVTFEEIREYVDDPVILNDIKHSIIKVPLDKTYTDNDKNLNEIIPDETSDLFLLTEHAKEEIELILEDFPEREREILYMYYGINYPRPYTLREIGIDIGLTRERIRQIKVKALEKLRKKTKADKLRSYLK